MTALTDQLAALRDGFDALMAQYPRANGGAS